jgi:hypothetical protein
MAPSPGGRRTFKPAFVHGSSDQWAVNVRKKRNLQDRDQDHGERTHGDKDQGNKLLRTSDSVPGDGGDLQQVQVVEGSMEPLLDDTSMDTGLGRVEEITSNDLEHNYESRNRGNVNVLFNADINSFYDETDVEPFIVHIESLPGTGNIGNIHPLAMGKKLFSSKIEGVSEIKRSSKNRIVCTFKSSVSANSFVSSNFGKENKLNVYIPSYQLERTGIVRHIDTDLSEEEIFENLKVSNDVTILSVKRLSKTVKNDDGSKHNRPIPLVSIKFKGKQLPEYINIFYNRCPVEPYIANPILCYRCIRFGHTSRNCKSQPRCPNCPNSHPQGDCPGVHSPTCLFCKGPHSSLSKLCPEYDVQKQIKEVMAYRNIPYKEAKSFLFPGPIKPSAFSNAVGSNYEKSFPKLPSQHMVSLREKLPLPSKNQSGILPNQTSVNRPTKIHETITTYHKSPKPRPSHSPKYTNSYYKQFQNSMVSPGKPVYSCKSKENSNLSPESNRKSVETLFSYLDSFKKNEIAIDSLIAQLKPMMNIDLYEFSNSNGHGYLSDTSF